MDELTKDSIYKGTLSLIRKDGIRFTVDDLASLLHISKKTLYAYFPSKEDLAKWIYSNAFYIFDSLLNKASLNPLIDSPLFINLISSYADLLILNDEDTFNRYSLNNSIKSSFKGEMASEREKMVGFINKTELSKFNVHLSFFPSFEASLLTFSKDEKRERLIEDYSKMLRSL